MIRVVACIAIAFGAPTLAVADIADDNHRAGEAAYRAADFRAAVAAFEEAYRRHRRPQTLFSLAQAYRQIYVADHDPGVLIRAVELYRQYLAEVPRGGRSDDTRELLSNLDPLVQLLREKHPNLKPKTFTPTTQIMVWSAIDGARAKVDGAPEAALPLVLDVTPGPRAVRVTAPGHATADLQVTAVADRLVPIEARLQALPARLAIATLRGSTIVIDGVPRESSAVELPAGSHRIWAGARGRLGIERAITLAPGDERELVLALPVSPRRRTARWIAGTTALLAGATAATLTYSLVRANHAGDLRDALETRSWTTAELAMYTDDRDTARDWRYVSLGLLVTTVATGAIASWLWFDDVPRPPGS